MKIGIECGQRFWSLHSWRVGSLFRRWDTGFAIGPVMVMEVRDDNTSLE